MYMVRKKITFLLIITFFSTLSLKAQNNRVGENTFNIGEQPFNFIQRSIAVGNHIFVNIVNENNHAIPSIRTVRILKLDTNLMVLDSLTSSDLGCSNCSFNVMKPESDSTFWFLLGALNPSQVVYKDKFSLLIKSDLDFNILDTMAFSFANLNLRSRAIDIEMLQDTVLITSFNDFPSFSVLRKSDFSILNDSLIAMVPFLNNILKEPLFWNNHWYFMTFNESNALRFWQISKDGRIDTILTLWEKRKNRLPFYPMRMLPGNSPKSAKLIAANAVRNSSQIVDRNQYQLFNIDLQNYTFTLLDSFALNLPSVKIQGITLPSFISLDALNNNVDWKNLDNIYIGSSRDRLFFPFDFKPGDSTLKRYLHLYKIDTAGNASWYRRLGDGSYYQFVDLTAHSHGVYITGIKYNWKNPPNGHVTEGFIMSINEKGEVIGQREIPVPTQQLSVFPNPASNHITLQDLPEQDTPFQYRLFNPQGQLLQRGETRGQITLQNLASGTYWVLLSSKESHWQGTSKVVVE